MSILKTYFVRVDTINDKDPTAQEIRFNNETIWTEKNGAVPNSDKITDVEPDTNADNNPRTIKNDNTMMTGISGNNDSVPKMDEIYEENNNYSEDEINPMTSSKPMSSSKNIPANKSDDATFENNPMIDRPQPSKSNKTVRNMGNSMKGTESSNAKITPRFSTVTQQKSLGGRKRTRKNKKKTKTMRRKRRNL